MMESLLVVLIALAVVFAAPVVVIAWFVWVELVVDHVMRWFGK